MDLEKLTTKVEESYNSRFKSLEKRVSTSVENIDDINELELAEIKAVTTTILDLETKNLQADVEALLAKKEAIERALEKKQNELQESKYAVFNALEEKLSSSESALFKLHQVKLQSIDLYDILSEMVESAIITALERDQDGDISETTIEVVKDIIFPYSKVGIIGSIILALGRALGETMAVAFLIGAVYSMPDKITDPTISIPVAMAVNFGEASGLGESALFYLGLVLFVLSFAISCFTFKYIKTREEITSKRLNISYSHV